MSFELPVGDDFDPNDMDDRIKDGRYRVLIQDIVDGDKSIEVSYEVRSGKVEGQEGKTGKEFLAKSAAAVKRVVLFALAAKLTTVAELTKCKEEKRKPSIELANAIGREIVVDVFGRKPKEGGRTFANWTFEGIFAIDDPVVSDVPAPTDSVAGVDDVAF